MLFPDRADYPLFDAAELVHEPACWPCHLFLAYDTRELMAMLDVDGADVDALSVRLEDPERWPYFEVPLRAGGHLAVIYRNSPEDAGIDFERAGADDVPVNIASLEGDPPGGVLAWDVLITIATTPPRRPGVVLPVARLLLLLPILADAPDDAVERVRSSFRPRSRYGRSLLDVACAVVDERREVPGGAYTKLWGRDVDGHPTQLTGDTP